MASPPSLPAALLAECLYPGSSHLGKLSYISSQIIHDALLWQAVLIEKRSLAEREYIASTPFGVLHLTRFRMMRRWVRGG